MLHIYIGDGKGKTSAAVGLAVRFAGHGGSVAVYHFLKSPGSGETAILARLPGVSVHTLPREYGFYAFADDGEKAEIHRYTELHLELALNFAKAGPGGLLVLDEALDALNLGILQPDKLSEVLACALESKTELVLTGREAPEELLAQADYVTIFKKIKHPFDRGTPGRKGIEF